MVGSLAFDFVITITGRDKNRIKEYLFDVIDYWLRDEVELEV